jgi:hypothetical protein
MIAAMGVARKLKEGNTQIISQNQICQHLFVSNHFTLYIVQYHIAKHS